MIASASQDPFSEAAGVKSVAQAAAQDASQCVGSASAVESASGTAAAARDDVRDPDAPGYASEPDSADDSAYLSLIGLSDGQAATVRELSSQYPAGRLSLVSSRAVLL